MSHCVRPWYDAAGVSSTSDSFRALYASDRHTLLITTR
jgi:hypothetical protein